MKGMLEIAGRIKAFRLELEKKHLSGAGGFEICREWASAVDALVVSLVEEAGGTTVPFALVALGGYGRSELNPFSDIDLLFLYDKTITKADGAIPGKVIPKLWDIGFKVGHSTRTIDDCLRISQNDLTSKTSMMESRFLAGDKEIYNRFEYRFRKNVMAKQVERFLKEKWVETELRHEQFFNSCFLTEPDIKESPGGLRDYHVALWAALARYEVRGIAEMLNRGLMEADEAQRAETAVDFLLRVRNDVHFLTNGPSNHFNFGVQVETAKRLGYKGESDAPVLEMMRTYFRCAETVFRLCQSIQDQAKRYRTKTQMLFFKPRYKELAPNVFAGEDEIFIKDLSAEDLAKDAGKVFLVLRLVVEKELAISGGLHGLLEKVGSLWKKERPGYPELGDGLRSVLSSGEPIGALRILRDCKLMTAVIPEFRAIRYLTPFDMYHKFTVAEHSFRAITEFDNLRRNEKPECDLLSAIYAAETRKDLMRLALLLHDIGKGSESHGDHEELDPAILERLGYPREDVETVTRLVRLHLSMNNVAQRRDIHDSKTIIEFCELVGDEATLKRLYMLTYADTCAVGPGVWNSWKGALLRDLFLLGASYFEGKDPLKWLAQGRMVPQEKITPELARFIKGMPDKYFFLRTSDQVVADGELFNRFMACDAPSMVRYRPADGDGTGEATLVSKNKIGLLYHVVGTFSSRNIDIHEAQVLTHKEDVAFDIFRVTGPGGAPINDVSFWERVSAEVNRVLSGEKTVDELMRNRKKLVSVQQHAPTIDTMVKTLNDVSFDHTVIETSAKDRIGLLYDVTRGISQMNADIVSARIATEGYRAVNTFYVCESGGKKILAPDRLEEIKTGVRNALLHIT
ncbi:MAG: [protein-PII] uridylyltransferase [Nitrospinae bacterium]|nr:[protein-PII] uridylyltransferase [Nitrospinota bacterium]